MATAHKQDETLDPWMSLGAAARALGGVSPRHAHPDREGRTRRPARRRTDLRAPRHARRAAHCTRVAHSPNLRGSTRERPANPPPCPARPSAHDAVDGSSAGIAMCHNCGVVRTAREEPSMEEITTVGLDIAKSVFQVHAVSAIGLVVIRRQLKRRQVAAVLRRAEALPDRHGGVCDCPSLGRES